MRNISRTNTLRERLADIWLSYFHLRKGIDHEGSRLINQQQTKRGLGSWQTDDRWRLDELIFVTFAHD